MIDTLALFVPALVLYREGMEAFLLTTFLLKVSEDHELEHKYVGLGILGGILVSILIALGLNYATINYEALTSVSTMIAGAVMIYVAFYNQKMAKHIAEHVKSVTKFTPLALFLAVVGIFSREGAEVVLILNSLWINNPLETALGLLLGILGLLLSYKVVKFGLDKIGTKNLFKWSGIIFGLLGIYYLADGTNSLLQIRDGLF